MAKLYMSAILISLLFLIGLNSILAIKVFNVTVFSIISAILTSFAMVIIIDCFFALLIGVLPRKWFGVKNNFFKVSKKEQIFYEKLGIRKWKNYVWDFGWLGGFSKQKIKDARNPKYFERFIVESNKGIIEHSLGIIFSFGIVLVYSQYAWSIGLPIALINLVLNTMASMVLRYNLPKLKVAYKSAIKKQNLNNPENSELAIIEQTT